MYNLLYITGELNYTDGVTSHLFVLLSELQKHKNFNITLICTGGDSIERFKEFRIKIFEDNDFEHSNRSVTHFTIALKSLVKIILKNKIDIVHSHNHYAANISYYASRFTKIKTVQTNHGFISESGFLKHFKAHKIITVNEQVKKYLIQNKKSTVQNVTFINQGFQYSGDIRKSGDKEIKIVCASRLIYEKGVDIFIRASKIVNEKFGGKLQFLIAGEGEYEGELKKLSGKIEADIVFLGTVKNLPGLFSKTNIFVMPSRSKSEGFPMTIVEAALTKNFIITSELSLLKNIFDNGIDGFTFETGNFQQLAEKLLAALNAPEKANQMTEHFYRKSNIIFDPAVMAAKHIEVYKECLKT